MSKEITRREIELLEKLKKENEATRKLYESHVEKSKNHIACMVLDLIIKEICDFRREHGFDPCFLPSPEWATKKVNEEICPLICKIMNEKCPETKFVIDKETNKELFL